MCVIKETFLEGTKSRSCKCPCREYLATAKCSTFESDSLQTQEQETANARGKVCGKGQPHINGKVTKETREREKQSQAGAGGRALELAAEATARLWHPSTGMEPLQLQGMELSSSEAPQLCSAFGLSLKQI